MKKKTISINDFIKILERKLSRLTTSSLVRFDIISLLKIGVMYFNEKE